MMLTKWNSEVPVLHGERFQLPVSSQCGVIICRDYMKHLSRKGC